MLQTFFEEAEAQNESEVGAMLDESFFAFQISGPSPNKRKTAYGRDNALRSIIQRAELGESMFLIGLEAFPRPRRMDFYHATLLRSSTDDTISWGLGKASFKCPSGKLRVFTLGLRQGVPDSDRISVELGVTPGEVDGTLRAAQGH